MGTRGRPATACPPAPPSSPKIKQGLRDLLAEVGAFLGGLRHVLRPSKPAVLLGTLGREAQIGALEQEGSHEVFRRLARPAPRLSLKAELCGYKP